MTAMLKLYEHVDQYEVMLAWIEEHEQDIRDAGGVLPLELEALLAEVEGGLEDKAEGTALVYRNLMANVDAARGEAKRLGEIAATYERQADVLKSYLFRSDAPGRGAERSSAPAQRCGSRPANPSVRLADPDTIPAAFQRVKVEFNASAAMAHLKENDCAPEAGAGPVEVDGLIVERGLHVRIK